VYGTVEGHVRQRQKGDHLQGVHGELQDVIYGSTGLDNGGAREHSTGQCWHEQNGQLRSRLEGDVARAEEDNDLQGLFEDVLVGRFKCGGGTCDGASGNTGYGA